MPIKGLNISKPSVEIRGLCSVINISRCPTNNDLKKTSEEWPLILNNDPNWPQVCVELFREVHVVEGGSFHFEETLLI